MNCSKCKDSLIYDYYGKCLLYCPVGIYTYESGKKCYSKCPSSLYTLYTITTTRTVYSCIDECPDSSEVFEETKKCVDNEVCSSN